MLSIKTDKNYSSNLNLNLILMKRSILLLGLVLLYSFTLVAQKGTLKGSVKDKKTHEGLIGASILIKGTTVGTTTNLDGEYVIENVGAGKTTVVVSLVVTIPQNQKLTLKQIKQQVLVLNLRKD